MREYYGWLVAGARRVAAALLVLGALVGRGQRLARFGIGIGIGQLDLLVGHLATAQQFLVDESHLAGRGVVLPDVDALDRDPARRIDLTRPVQGNVDDRLIDENPTDPGKRLLAQALRDEAGRDP